MKEILLTQGRVALVDDEDFEYLSQWKWRFDRDGYAIRNSYPDGKLKRIYMHRVLLSPAHGQMVDHIDGDGLNNQKSNLRRTSRAFNAQNVRYPRNKTGYKGVHPSGKRFVAMIQFHGKQIFIGRFSTPEEAANAYDIKALELYGEHAATNAKIKLHRNEIKLKK